MAMSNWNDISICIVGVGNDIRSDDGIGSYVCNAFEKMSIPGFTILHVQQLDVEIIEELLPYRHILIVDASMDGNDVDLYELAHGVVAPLSSSHHINVAMLTALAQRLYSKKLSLFICAVRGYDFEMGNMLSEKAKANCNQAISQIHEWVNSLKF
jgi:hydrogenase maturation protease